MEREFSTAILLSLTGGTLLCKFDKMHEAAEFVLGHSVWTHEFGDLPTVNRLRNAVLAQHPQLADFPHEEVTPENWQQKLAEAEAKYGKVLTVKQGTDERTETPVDSFLRMKGKE